MSLLVWSISHGLTLTQPDKTFILLERKYNMKKLWGRIGVEIELGDDEYKALVEENGGKGLGELIQNHFSDEGRIQISGETYFPADDSVYDNPDEELNYLF